MGRKRAPPTTVTVSALSAPNSAKEGSDGPEAMAPFVGYFPSGYQACGSGEGDDSGLAFTLYGHKKSRRQRVLVAHKDGVDFVGRTSAEESKIPPACKYAVATFSKATGKLEVMPVSGGSLCRLEVRAMNADYTAENMFGSTADVSRHLQNRRLVDAFGSTRRQRQLANTEMARVDVEHIGSVEAVAEMMSKAAEKAEQAGMTKDKVMARVVGRRNIPAHNLTATTSEGAFPLAEVVPAGVRLDTGKLLTASENSEAAAQMREKGFVHSYALSRVTVLQAKENAPEAYQRERKHRAKALAYLSMLLNLHSAPKTLRSRPLKGGMSQLAKSARVQEDSMEPLLEMFYERNSEGEDVYSRSQGKGELLLCHICLAALLAERSKMDSQQFEDLRVALKMTPSDLVSRFRELGAKATAVAKGGNASRTYHIALLQDGRTLQESLPNIKIGRKAGK